MSSLRFRSVLLLSCVLVAIVLRLSLMDSRPLWADEAESCINALTILERGYPSDHYLGLPIYENILLTTTPDSEEYEFRDSSYSNRGMAIYHGWLPLYSIAAAYAIAGIHPDHDDGRPPAVRHRSQEFVTRTMVPRIPSILFAVLFFVCAYRLGRTMSGDATAWSVLMAAAFAPVLVGFGSHARYYSATLALSALSGLAVWNLTRKGRWRDSAATGLALVLLFHTHSLSFVILTIVLLANLPFGFRHTRPLSKFLLTGTIVALGLLPWMSWTGFLDSAASIPSAWPLLVFPQDFVLWFTTRKAFVTIIVTVLVLALLSAAWPHRLFDRLATAATTDRHAIYFTLTWFVIAYLCFIFLIPAASFFQGRLTLVLALPGYLVFALCITTASRAIAPRFAVPAASLAMLVFLGIRGSANLQFPQPITPNRIEPFVEVVSNWRLEPGTKLYAWPNDNLTLTYYLGLPVQSIAPVRKSFLDSYPGDIILFETNAPYVQLAARDVQAMARESGSDLSVEEAEQAGFRIQRHGAREYLQGRVADIWPPSERLAEIELKLLERYKEHTRRAVEEGAIESPLLREFTSFFMTSSRWLPAFYWFVDPAKRTGDQLNYRDRIRSATAIVLPNGSIIFDSRQNRDVPLVDREQYLALMQKGSIDGN